MILELLVEIQREFKDFKLEVAFCAGEKTLGILGPSGSGKSMTLRAIAGLETPSRGRIVLNGRTLFDSKRGINLPSRKRRMGFLLQDYALFPHMTVAENIGFGLRHLSRHEAGKRVAEQLARVQLQGLENRYPGSFPAASNSARRWLGPWRLIRRRFCWMSRFPRLTSTCAARWKLCSLRRFPPFEVFLSM